MQVLNFLTRTTRLNKRLISATICGLIFFAQYFCIVASVISLAPQSARGQTFPSVAKTSDMENLVAEAAEQDIAIPETPFDNGATQAPQFWGQSLATAAAAFIQGLYDGQTDWAKFIGDIILGVIKYIANLIAQPLSKLLQWVLNQAIYNPNIAKNDPPEIAQYIKPITNIMNAIAIDLLLILFILTIWKHWTEAAVGGRGNLMGAVGRLIATAALLVAWSTICDYWIQISNDMIAQVIFDPVRDKQLIQAALSRLIETGLVSWGVSATFGGLLVGPLGNLVFFALLAIIVFESLAFLVLKSIQNALMIAQFMFAPIFLVCFATPETEKITAGYVRSCIEVSLWSFFWMGFLRLLVIILGTDWNPFGQIIVTIGVLELMLQVPGFMARAQISPVSEYIGGFAIFRTGQFLAKGLPSFLQPQTGLLSKAMNSFMGTPGELSMATNSAGVSPDLQSLRNAGGGGPAGGPSSPGGPGTPGGPGSGGGNPTAPGSPLVPPGGAGARLASPFHRTGRTPANPNAANADARRGFINSAVGELAGKMSDKHGKPLMTLSEAGGDPSDPAGDYQPKHTFDEQTKAGAITHAIGATPEQKAQDFLERSVGDKGMQDSRLLGAAMSSIPYLNRPGSDLKPDEQKRIMQARAHEEMIKGAGAWLRGEPGNDVTGQLQQRFGDVTPQERAEMLNGLTNEGLPQSPWHPNYGNNKKAVEGAGLAENAATMAMADSTRLRGPELSAAYNALARSLAPGLQAAGHTPGTPAYTAALGRAITGATADRQKAAAAVGIGFMGTNDANGFSDQDWEAYVERTENLARETGTRHDAAFGAFRGMMNTPAASPAQDPRGVSDRLATAAQALSAMREQRVPQQAISAEGFSGHMYTLAKDGNLTPARVLGAMKAANVTGLDHFTPAAGDLAEAMLDSDIGGWKAGEITSGNMALADKVRSAGGTVHRDVAQRVLASGVSDALFGVAVATAMRTDWDNMQPARTGSGINAIVTESHNRASAILSAPGAPVGDINSLAAGLARGDISGFSQEIQSAAAPYVINSSDALTYSDLASQSKATGVHYPIQIVREARSLASEGHFQGKVTNAASYLANALPAASAGGSVADHVVRLASHVRAGDWNRGMTQTELHVVDKYLAPMGLAHETQLVERIIQMQSANAGASIGSQQVVSLLNHEVAKHDMGVVMNASGLLNAYAAASVDAQNPGSVDIKVVGDQLRSLPAKTVTALLAIQQQGGTQAAGQDLINLVAAVDAVRDNSGGNGEMISFVVKDMSRGDLAQPGMASTLARASEIYTANDLRQYPDRVAGMQMMSNEWGWDTNKIRPQDVVQCEQISNLSVGGNTLQPTRVLVERLNDAGISTSNEQDLVVIAARPEMASLRGHSLRQASVGVQNYFNASPNIGLSGEPRWDALAAIPSNNLQACVAVQQVLGADQCMDRAYVDSIAQNSSLNTVASQQDVSTRVRFNGAGYFVDYTPPPPPNP